MMKKRIVSILVFFSIIFALITSVMAIDAGTVQQLTAANNETKTDGDKTVTLTYTSAQLNDLTWYDKDDPTGSPDVTRPASGWWIGYKVTLPSGVTASEVTVERDIGGNKATGGFNPDVPGGNACSYWIGITENTIEGKTEEFTHATIVYKKDNEVFLTVVIKIDPSGVELKKDERMVTVDVDGVKFTLLKDKTLQEGLSASDLESLQSMIGDGTLVDRVTDEEVILSETVIDDDRELTVKAPVVPTPEPTPEVTPEPIPEEVKDTTPKTGTSIDLEKSIALGMLLSIVGLVVMKKYSK